MLEDELIKDAKEWIDSYYEDECQYKKNNYNIFNVLGVQHKEILHCRVLYDLLNKEGNHYQEDLFLKKFYKLVLNREYDNKSITVEKEFYLDNENRLDLLLIETKDNIETKIPIEVKIYAPEGYNQLQRYADLCNGDVYFLTLEGRNPGSIEPSQLNRVKKITFEYHIRKWLDECIKECTSEKVKNILIQYKQVLDELTGQKEKYIYKKLNETNNNKYFSIIEEYKNKKDLGDIQKTLLAIYDEYIKLKKARPYLDFKNRIFKEIVEHIQLKEVPYEPIDVDSYLNKTDDYFFHPATKDGFPSVVFKFMQNQEGNQCIAFSLDIAVYVCVCLKFYKKINNVWVSCDIDENELDTELKSVKDNFVNINKRHCPRTGNLQYFFWERTKYNDEDINFTRLESINESIENEIIEATKEHLDEFIERLSYTQKLLNK